MQSATVNTLFDETLRTDFKAEVIAAELIDTGIPIERVLILMLGAARRTHRKDVEEVIEDVSDYDHKAYTHIKTHKEGIYDMLPEGLFHSPTVPKSAKNEDDIILALKRHHVEEANARKFFLPFEAAINDLRIQMALHENRLDKRLYSNDMVDIFSGQWEIFKWLDARQANIFLHLLPLIHDLRENFNVAATIFEIMFLVPAKISLQAQKTVYSNSGNHAPVNEIFLGVNFTTGDENIYGGEDELLIEIGPMPNAALQYFNPGGKNKKILELLCDYLMPADLDLKILFSLEAADKCTRLSYHNNDYNATLGLSTYL